VIKEYNLSVITTVTGKNQVTIPAEIVGKAGLKSGTRLEWKTTDRRDVLEVRILPDRSAIAASLRGRGRASGTRGKEVLARLEQERAQDDRYWPSR